MYDLVQSMNVFLATITLLCGLFVLLTLGIYLLRAFRGPYFAEGYVGFFRRNGLLFALLISLVAVLGSLFYSEVAKFAPCKLCWYQRIAMYPLLIILTVAASRGDRGVFKYAFPLSFIGLCIAIYHYCLQMVNTFTPVPDSLTPCSTVGMTPSCVDYFFLHFGYITIPMMSLTAFAGISLLLLMIRKRYR